MAAKIKKITLPTGETLGIESGWDCEKDEECISVFAQDGTYLFSLNVEFPDEITPEFVEIIKKAWDNY